MKRLICFWVVVLVAMCVVGCQAVEDIAKGYDVSASDTPMHIDMSTPEPTYDMTPVVAVDSNEINTLLNAIVKSPEYNSELRAHIADNREAYDQIVDMGYGALSHLCTLLEREGEGLSMLHYRIAHHAAIDILKNVYTTHTSKEQLELLNRTDQAITDWEVRRGYPPYYQEAMMGKGGVLLAVWRDASITGDDAMHYTLTGIWNMGVYLSSIYQGFLTTTNLEYIDYVLSKIPDAEVLLSQVNSHEVTEAELQGVVDTLYHDHLHVNSGWYENITDVKDSVTMDDVSGMGLSSVDQIQIRSYGNWMVIDDPALLYDYLLYLNALRLTEHDNQEITDETEDFIIKIKVNGDTFLWVKGFDNDIVDINNVKYHVQSKDVLVAIHHMNATNIHAQNDKAFNNLQENIIQRKVMPREYDASYSYFPTIHEKIKMWKDIQEGTAKYAYLEYQLSDSEMEELYEILANCTISYDRMQIASNTDFHIRLEYEDGMGLFLNAYNDGRVHVWYRHKSANFTAAGVIDSEELYRFITKEAGSLSGFSFDEIGDVDRITIQYIADHQLKFFDEDFEYTKIKIKDEETIQAIADTIKQHSIPTMTYPCRENSDLILHRDGEDIFLKLKYPGDNMFDEFEFNEPTIIVNGYYWFENVELYKLLKDLSINRK